MAAQKFLQHDGNGAFKEVVPATSGGAADANKIPALDSNGQFPPGMMSPGIGADVVVVPAAEALSAGDFVNLFDNGGTYSARKADASAVGKRCHGYVISAVANGANATVYRDGNNGSVTGVPIGGVYLSATTPGGVTGTPPSAPGQIVQQLGVATSATNINFEAHETIELA